jgi:ribosomal-protein-alanine N-acetyltransferase
MRASPVTPAPQREPAMSTPVPTLTTPRLVLRPLDLADVEAVQTLFPRWEIVRFMGTHVPWPYPADGALTFIRDIALPAMQQGKGWFWSIRPKTAPEQLIGAINVKDSDDDENRGFWLDPAWQGRGLMSEASAAVTDYWFEVLQRPVLRVSKAIANEPSRRLSERSGMRVIRTDEREYLSGRIPAQLWEITREEWRRRSR